VANDQLSDKPDKDTKKLEKSREQDVRQIPASILVAGKL
jgi:hypothetical protein